VQSVQSRPEKQVQREQRGELIEGANEMFGRPPPQDEQRKPAPEIPEQPGAQAVRFQGARGQLRSLRSRSMSLS
jgi:hypothetical protein